MKKNVIILGYGVSGQAVAKLAEQLDDKILIVDEGIKDINDVPYHCRTTIQQTDLETADLIVCSPGIPPSSPVYQAALASGIPMISELEYGFRHCQVPILAITGTNGKTTCTELTCHLLKALGFNALTAGNIGNPLCSLANQHYPDNTIVVAEISSFQLELPVADSDFTFAPESAVILNISSDHQNRYDSFRHYGRTKFRIFKNIQNNTHVIVNAKMAPDWQNEIPEDAVFIGHSDYWHEKGGEIYFQDKLVIDLKESVLNNPHNAENTMASLALIASHLGLDTIDKTMLQKAICEFRTGEHRLEQFLEKDGITYVNDSKSTNPDSTVAALKTYGNGKNIRLILGGLDKDMDFSILCDYSSSICKAYLIGECQQKIATCLNDCVELELFNDFNSAVCKICQEAQPGEVVMLSPACASMDMFKNYKERGEIFKQQVMRIKADV